MGATIRWSARVEAEPSSPITETPQWGDLLRMSEVPPGTTNLEFALQTARVLGLQFVERYLQAMGAETTEIGPSIVLKDYRVSVTIEKVDKS